MGVVSHSPIYNLGDAAVIPVGLHNVNYTHIYKTKPLRPYRAKNNHTGVFGLVYLVLYAAALFKTLLPANCVVCNAGLGQRSLQLRNIFRRVVSVYYLLKGFVAVYLSNYLCKLVLAKREADKGCVFYSDNVKILFFYGVHHCGLLRPLIIRIVTLYYAHRKQVWVVLLNTLGKQEYSKQPVYYVLRVLTIKTKFLLVKERACVRLVLAEIHYDGKLATVVC